MKNSTVRLTVVIAAALAIAACAVVQPPPGGPEDRTPPYIVDLEPEPDSAGVARDAKVVISFSEKVDRDSFKDRVRAYPPAEFKDVKVKANRLIIEFREALPETTICVVLKGGFRDHHRVENKEHFIFHFATSPALDYGSISGKIMFKNKLDSTGVAKIFAVTADTLVNLSNETESRIAFAGPDGGFTFKALPTDSARFLLWAFGDRDGDGKYSSGKEFSIIYPDTIVLTERYHRFEDIMLNIIDPNEPANVTGRVINETGLPQRPMIRFEPLMPGESPVVIRADSTGNFTMPKVPPGAYVVFVFIDMHADSLCGDYTVPEDSTDIRREPCLVFPDTLVIEPGEKRNLEPITLENGK